MATKRAIVATGHILGNVMIASGSEMVARGDPFVSMTIVGKYEPRIGGMTANERFLSEAAYENFKRDRPAHIKKVGDKGPPTKTQRFSTVIEPTRGYTKPTWFTPGGKVVAHPEGAGFVQSERDFEARQKDQSVYKKRGRARILGGAVLRYAIAPAMYLYSAYTLLDRYRSQEVWMQEEWTNLLGPVLGPVTAGAVDVLTGGGIHLDPLPEGKVPSGSMTMPPLFYMEWDPREMEIL